MSDDASEDLAGDLSPETAEVLRLARGERMSPARKRRLKGAVLTSVAAASAATLAAGQGTATALGAGKGVAAAAAAGQGAAAAAGAGFVAKAVVGVALVGSLGAGGYLALAPARRHAEARAAHVVAPPARAVAPVVAPRAVVEPPPVAAAPPVVERLARAHHAPARREPPRAAPDAAASLAAETALLRDADRALRAGDSATALARLDEHAARFPRGALAPERAAERLIVLCQLGVADPRDVARLLAERSGSPLAARVRRACAAPP